MTSQANPSIPYGYCQCGCGRNTNNGSRYLRGHSSRKPVNEHIALSVEGSPAIGLIANKLRVIVIDPTDLGIVGRERWNVNSEGYAESVRDTKRFKMHQILLPCPEGFEPDHKNRIRSDNRRSNLRPVTRSQNMMNCSLASGRAKSGHRGISWDKITKKWRVELMVNYKHINVGRFEELPDAVTARDSARKQYFGEFA